LGFYTNKTRQTGGEVLPDVLRVNEIKESRIRELSVRLQIKKGGNYFISSFFSV
jgi:hypothetical protein